jgi:glutaredoxin 3
MKDVVIYTTTYCGYCVRAKSLLDRRNIPYVEIDVTGDPDARRKLAVRSGRRTVPQIFVDGQPIGGSDELHALDRMRALAPTLAS